MVAKSEADRCGHQSGCIIDTIAKEKCLGLLRGGPHEFHFLFRALRSMDFLQADKVRKISDFALSVPRHQHQLIKSMLSAKMLDERLALPPRRIVENIGGCVGAIDSDFACQPAADFGKNGFRSPELFQKGWTIRDPNGASSDHAFEPAAGSFADFAGVIEVESRLLCGMHDSPCQRVLRILFDACHQL